MRQYFPGIIIGWTVLIIGTLIFNLYLFRKNSETLEKTKLKTLFQLLVTTRQWNSDHGKVYVPVTETMRPNPYLIHSRRDIVSNFGDSLTLVNPAFMTRQLSELSETAAFHITSLNPIRPANKADEWETKALQSFKKTGDEYFEKVTSGDSVIYRYMAPLITGQSCLACHASQGYKLGDIRGGISVNTPYHMDACMKANLKKIVIAYVLIFLIGLFAILYFNSALSRHRTEMEAKNKKIEEVGRAKDKFFSIVAHDLKTPAANIKHLSERLKTDFDELSEEERKSYIDMLFESAKTHNNLLNELLDLSRLRTGSISYTPERLNIRVLADTVLEQTKLQALQKHITQINEVDDCFAKGDNNMVTAVLRNLVVNAIKFTHPEGRVTIRARYDRNNVIVSVTDTGIGIPEETTRIIFDPVHKKSTPGTANESGSGLGLLLCKEFVERNGGKIRLESEVGSGTTFFFTLPADA